jgi:O-antigen/teichoic acid export membrane protein
MLIATLVSGVLSYLANVIVGRMLGPTDYSVYTSMLSLSLIIGAVASVIQTVTTNYVAQLKAIDQLENVGTLLFYQLRYLLPWAILGVALLWLFGRAIAGILQLASPLPVWVIATFLVPTITLPVLLGGLRGLERFGSFGINAIGLASLRLAIGMGLILAGWGVSGAVASLPLAYLGATLLAVVCLADIIRLRDRAFLPDFPRILSYSTYVAIGLFAFSVLSNFDLLIVKSHFKPDEAGLYSAISTIGKIALYLPATAGILLLPKVSALKTRQQSTIHLLNITLWAVGAMCSLVTVVFYLYSSIVVKLLFGANFVAQADLLGPYGLAMTLFSLCNVWLVYYLALEDQRYSYILLSVALLQAIALSMWSLNLHQIVNVLIGSGVILNVLGIGLLPYSRYSKRRQKWNSL